jgi:hypothetical protein
MMNTPTAPAYNIAHHTPTANRRACHREFKSGSTTDNFDKGSPRAHEGKGSQGDINPSGKDYDLQDSVRRP